MAPPLDGLITAMGVISRMFRHFADLDGRDAEGVDCERLGGEASAFGAKPTGVLYASTVQGGRECGIEFRPPPLTDRLLIG